MLQKIGINEGNNGESHQQRNENRPDRKPPPTEITADLRGLRFCKRNWLRNDGRSISAIDGTKKAFITAEYPNTQHPNTRTLFSPGLAC